KKEGKGRRQREQGKRKEEDARKRRAKTRKADKGKRGKLRESIERYTIVINAGLILRAQATVEISTPSSYPCRRGGSLRRAPTPEASCPSEARRGSPRHGDQCTWPKEYGGRQR